MTRPDYLYILTETKGRTRYIKIGHTTDLSERGPQLQTGNPRRLRTVFAMLGGREMEAEIKKRFKADRIGTGGTEWFKWTPELREFIYEKIDCLMLIGPISSPHKFGNGPSSLQIAELGQAETVQAKLVTVQGAIQPCDIATASRPKSVYERIRKEA